MDPEENATSSVADDDARVVSTEVAADDQPQLDPQDGQDPSEGSQDPPAEEFAEVEYEGQTYKVPPVLKDAFLRNLDYTRKTQEVAEQRRALDSERQTFAQQAEVQRQFLREVGQVENLDSQLAEFADYDWDEYERLHPDHAARDWTRFQRLTHQRGELVNSITAKQQQQALTAERESANLRQQAAAELARDIKDWSPAKAQEITKFGSETYGFSNEELLAAGKKEVLVLHDALQWRAHQAEEAKKAKALAAQKTAPAHTVRGHAGRFEVSGDTDDFEAFERMAANRTAKR